jgi:hypothetical protein
MRRLAPLALALVALAAPAARADQASRSQEAFVGGTAQACRAVAGTDTHECDVDGYDLSAANVAEYEASWTHRALGLQRDLGRTAPLRDVLLPHTHNSFNSEAYTPSVSRLDHNQLLSITDQLRLDMRAIEIDVHRAPSVTEGRIGVVACHAEPAGGTPIHPGCTNEEPLSFYLAELRTWLDANPTELVVLYLENNLDGDAAAHDEAAANIEDALGDLVFRPEAPCAEMPADRSIADLAPKQVLIVGNCGPGAWGGWVHERGARWDESSNPAGDDYDCAADRAAHDYDREITRRYEDRTWLSAMAGGEGGITDAEMRAMVQCGVNLVGFDMLHPDDPRLDALVWSWAPGEPSSAGCALQTGTGRWVARPCGERHRVACFAEGQWTVSAKPVRFAKAAGACAFAAPWNGWENQRLLAVGGGDVWVRSEVEAAP